MNKLVPWGIVRFIILILLQVLLLNNIQLNGYINPYLYVLFIIVLPFETPGWLGLILAFAMGISVDLFSHTPGVHASATVFMMAIRPVILEVFAPREGYEANSEPRIQYYGFSWFIKYAFMMVFAHHLFLFYIEVFKFSDFFGTLLRVILSTIFTVILVVLSQYFYKRKY